MPPGTSSFFLEELEKQVDECYREREDSPSTNQPISHYHAPEVGILAYEEV